MKSLNFGQVPMFSISLVAIYHFMTHILCYSKSKLSGKKYLVLLDCVEVPGYANFLFKAQFQAPDTFHGVNIPLRLIFNP